MNSETPSLLLLVLGFFPVAYIITLSVKYGFYEAVSLRPVGILFFWIGYHLSPWIYYFTGTPWDRFLLLTYEINNGLLFSTLCSIFYLAGYAYSFRKRDAIYRSKNLYNYHINISYRIVLLLCFVVFIVSVITAGGLDELWSATRGRGEGQFDVRDWIGKINRILTVLHAPLTLLLVIVSSLLVLKRTKSPIVCVIGIVGLLIASLHSMYEFSRGSGFSFILFAFIALRLNGLRFLPYAVLVIIPAIYLGSVGLNERGNYNPGVGNFLSAMFNPQVQSSATEQHSLAEWVNPLDAQAPFTRLANSITWQQPSAWDLGPKLIWNLNPLPSEIVPLYQIGMGISEMMGTVGSTGITTPSFAQLYFVFGYAGSLILLVIGLLSGWFEKRFVYNPTVFNLFSVIVVFAAFPIGLHSGLRPMTRPFVYAISLILIFRSKLIKKRMVTLHIKQ